MNEIRTVKVSSKNTQEGRHFTNVLNSKLRKGKGDDIMLEFNLKNFEPIDTKGARFEWTVEYKPGEYFKAWCEDNLGYKKQYVLSKYGEEIITMLDNVQIMRKVNQFMCNGNGHVKLNNGKVISRTISYIKSELWSFMEQYGITSIKRFQNEDGDIFITKCTDTKSSAVILPSKSKFNILINSEDGRKCIYNNFTMHTPCIVKQKRKDDPMQYIHYRSTDLFVLFDEHIFINGREFFKRSIVSNSSNIMLFKDLLDELKIKGLLDPENTKIINKEVA